MRVGISWEFGADFELAKTWQNISSQIQMADRLGFDSAWLAESDDAGIAQLSPAICLTNCSRETKSIQLNIHARRVAQDHPVRIAAETAVLDQFSRGRSGLGFAGANEQNISVEQVCETIEFVRAAWALDEFRYNGAHIKFPAHIEQQDAPKGISTPEFSDDWVPQWESGGAIPDFLTVTPKPYKTHTPVYVDITDGDEMLAWAACHGVSPFISAHVPSEKAVKLLEQYRSVADKAGRASYEVDPVLERYIGLDGETDTNFISGGNREIVAAIRELSAVGAVTHLVWHRKAHTESDLQLFASEIQPLLQA